MRRRAADRGMRRGAAQAPEHPLGALGDPAAVHVQRRGDVGGRRAVDEHREQREVVGVDAVRRGVELRTGQRRQRGLPRATIRIASNSSAGGAALSTSPSAPTTRATSSTSASGSAV